MREKEDGRDITGRDRCRCPHDLDVVVFEERIIRVTSLSLYKVTSESTRSGMKPTGAKFRYHKTQIFCLKIDSHVALYTLFYRS